MELLETCSPCSSSCWSRVDDLRMLIRHMDVLQLLIQEVIQVLEIRYSRNGLIKVSKTTKQSSKTNNIARKICA